MANSKNTTSHGEIRKFVEERDGKPALVKSTDNKNGAGILRIDFPGGAGEDTLKTISWNEFFETFDRHKLAMIYQEETKDGKESRFVKFVSRDEK